ncbi:hypothetical protein MKX03_016044 [Papaver bracteatum]|nr:hypothetical protein MKX03_016044 [Papaver bracteatum]
MPSSHDHSKRYGSSSVLLGYKFIVGASILVLAAIIFIFPSLMDSVVWIPEAHTSSTRSTTCDTALISSVPAELFGNSTGPHLTETNCMENSKWVKINGLKPYYPPGACPYLRKGPFACYENGRPDNQFLQWQWQWQSQQTNAGCNNIPNPGFFNPTDFLNRLRDKKLVFVGDSLNRNMYMSMICMLWNAIPDKSRIVKFPKDTEFKIRGDLSRRYEDYNCSVVFVWSPYLIYEANQTSRGSKMLLHQGPRTLRLDLIDELPALVYRDADIVVFDSWHWWNVDKTNHGENIFFLVFRGGKWNTGGKCNRETELIMSNETYIKTSPSRAKILEDVLGEMKSHVLYLNVSKLTYYRVDGHPSVYAKNYSVQERIIALDHQDCSHWCLPGVPDTWNELLYASLLKAAKGSFGRQPFGNSLGNKFPCIVP